MLIDQCLVEQRLKLHQKNITSIIIEVRIIINAIILINVLQIKDPAIPAIKRAETQMMTLFQIFGNFV